MKRVIVENSPHAFLNKFVEAVKDGYVLKNTPEGVIQEGMLFEVVMYKEEWPRQECPVTGKITDVDPKDMRRDTLIAPGIYTIPTETLMNLFTQLERFIRADALIKEFEYNPLGIHFVVLYVESKEVHTKESLDKLSWEEFKEVAKNYSAFNRNRDVATQQLLKVFGEKE